MPRFDEDPEWPVRDPAQLPATSIDPAIRKTVLLLNKLPFLATTLSCEGHEDPAAWASRVEITVLVREEGGDAFRGWFIDLHRRLPFVGIELSYLNLFGFYFMLSVPYASSRQRRARMTIVEAYLEEGR
ncbi:MAG: hypothetical protein V3U45_03035 [bacterium]